VNLSTQIHDFNAGFGPPVDAKGANGFGDRVFWTAAIPGSDLHLDFASGKAELHVQQLADFNYHDANASIGPDWQTAYVPAKVSFDVVWNGPLTRQFHVEDGSNGNSYSGEFEENQATVTWSVKSADGFRFQSNPGDFATSAALTGNGTLPGSGVVATLGYEGNGRFADTLTVLNTQDSGLGSLRDEIAAADSGDTIVFAPNLKGQTITLTSDQLTINKSLDIEGPGTHKLAVSGGDANRIFKINAGLSVTIAGLTITHGQAGGSNGGGGILNVGSALALVNDTFSNNEAVGNNSERLFGGGAITNRTGATLTIAGCSFIANQAIGGSGGFGEGISNDGLSIAAQNVGMLTTLTVTETTITDTQATGGTAGTGGSGGTGVGGGVYFATGGEVCLDDATLLALAGNLASTSNDDLFGVYMIC
jgi:hypothetical protein